LTGRKKQEWLSFIEQFYDEIEQWLKPYSAQGKLEYDYYSINLTEEYIGNYAVKAMGIRFAGQQIKIKPIGTTLIGTSGRIDMEGVRGRIQFILANKDSKGFNISTNKSKKQSDLTWKIVLKEQRQIFYDEFNEENFFAALMEIVND